MVKMGKGNTISVILWDVFSTNEGPFTAMVITCTNQLKDVICVSLSDNESHDFNSQRRTISLQNIYLISKFVKNSVQSLV